MLQTWNAEKFQDVCGVGESYIYPPIGAKRDL